MRVGIIQSCYLPWRGYFDFIDDVDLFLLFDDIQLPMGRSWRSRNRIRTPQGLAWLTVPVEHERADQRICDTRIHYAGGKDWVASHLGRIREAYRRAPYFATYFPRLSARLEARPSHLSTLNAELTQWLAMELGITTPIRSTLGLGGEGAKTARLLSLLGKVGGTSYLSGPVAEDYMDEDAFRAAGIELIYKNYDYPPYPQQGEGFEPAVSIIDLLFNLGPDARSVLKSNSPNVVRVPAPPGTPGARP